jgi:hypothetical protein
MTPRRWFAIACSAVTNLWSISAFATVGVPVDLTVTNVGATSVTFTWTGSSPAFRAIYKAGSLPASPVDGTVVFDGLAEGSPPNTATATGLSVNTRYFIAVYGEDVNNYSASAVSTSIITRPTRPIAGNGYSTPWEKRGVPTAGGKFIYATDSGDLAFFDGNTVQTVQPQGPLTGTPNTVFAMGSGSTAGHVIAGWRRGTDDAYLSVDGAAPVRINATNPLSAADPTNCEFISIDNGYVFAVFRAPLGGSEVRNVFVVDPATGNATNITNDTAFFGAYHISSSANKAAWAFKDGSGLYKLQYYDGTNITDLDTDIAEEPKISQGRIVYAKNVAANRADIFTYDTNLAPPLKTQLTFDPAKTNDSPQTDGRHAAWIRRNTNGTSPELVLNGVQITNGNFAPLELAAPPFGLDRGQLLWRDTSNVLHYLTSYSEDTVDRSTAVNTTNPYLADGSAVFFDSNAPPRTMYLFSGTAPADAKQPSPPMTLKATPSGTSVNLTWDAVLGATSYNLYYAAQPGVSKDEYRFLAGGVRITNTGNAFYTVSGLTTNSPYYFVVTAVDPNGEGAESREASVSLIGPGSWALESLGGQEVSAVAADRTVANTLYAAGNFPGPYATYISTDTGTTWTPLPAGGINGLDVRAIAADSGRVFASLRNGSIYRSLNSGGAWTLVTPLGTSSGQFTQGLAIDPAVPNTIVAADITLPTFTGSGNDSNVIRTDNNGLTWFHTPQSTSPDQSLATYALAFDPTHSSTLFAAGNGTPNVAKSIAGGAGWPGASPAGGYVYTIAVDPRNSKTVYAGIQQPSGSRGVWKSVDGAATWTRTTLFAPVRVLVIDPADSNVLHAGTETGYYYSIDGGATWTPNISGLGTSDAQLIETLAMAGNHRLIAGTYDGLYLLDLAALFGGDVATPANVVATAFDQSNISVSWDAVPGATAYDVYFRRNGSGYDAPVTLAGSPPPHQLLSFAGPDVAYLVRIVAVKGAARSRASAPELATTINFDNDPLSPGSSAIKYLHLDELRRGTNAIRFLAGLSPFTFSTANVGSTITAAQLTQIRNALDPALDAIHRPSGSYTNVLAPGVPIRAVHFQEIRERFK